MRLVLADFLAAGSLRSSGLNRREKQRLHFMLLQKRKKKGVCVHSLTQSTLLIRSTRKISELTSTNFLFHSQTPENRHLRSQRVLYVLGKSMSLSLTPSRPSPPRMKSREIWAHSTWESKRVLCPKRSVN